MLHRDCNTACAVEEDNLAEVVASDMLASIQYRMGCTPLLVSDRDDARLVRSSNQVAALSAVLDRSTLDIPDESLGTAKLHRSVAAGVLGNVSTSKRHVQRHPKPSVSL